MNNLPVLPKIQSYFSNRFNEHGSIAQGSDWNSSGAQEGRFDQLLKVVDFAQPFSIMDFGCGYAALYDYLSKRTKNFQYYGIDVVEDVLTAAKRNHFGALNLYLFSSIDPIPHIDYSVVSGTFNVRFDIDFNDWTQYVIDSITKINEKTQKGFSFNLLTKYSDKEFMKAQLYYADPCFFFDYCKRNFSRNVTLLHDYDFYDFTILVRKG